MGINKKERGTFKNCQVFQEGKLQAHNLGPVTAGKEIGQRKGNKAKERICNCTFFFKHSFRNFKANRAYVAGG